MHKTLLSFITLLTLTPSAQAQVLASSLPGKYHLTAQAEVWSPEFADLVTIHDDFVFTLSASDDGTYRFSNFFYSGMDEDMAPLDYSATATYDRAESMLTVLPTPWMWDNANSTFMDPYSHAPMLYFAVERDAHQKILLHSAANSLGFYVLANLDGTSKFYYAVDYPGEIVATRLDTYPSVTAEELPGTYVMNYVDYDGQSCATEFVVQKTAGGFVLTGLFGSDMQIPVRMDADGCGLTLPLVRDVNNGYYINYFGTVLGECNVTFRFDAQGRWLADNAFMYTGDFVNWIDAFDATVTRKDAPAAVDAPIVTTSPAATYSLSGRPARDERVVIRDGRVMMMR